MKAATAIKKFMGTQGTNPNMTYPSVSVSEIKELKEATSNEEWIEFGRHACEAMGEEFEE